MKKYIIPSIEKTALADELMVGVYSDSIDPGSSLAPKHDDGTGQWLDEIDRNYGGIRSRRLHDDFE